MTDVTDTVVQERAARAIQSPKRIYRGYRTRREINGCGVAASSRWLAGGEAGCRDTSCPNLQDDDPSPARKNWQRAVSAAIQAGTDQPGPESASLDQTDMSDHSEFLQETSPKMMDLQYFLEMVDVKHRHGSNLRAYHALWKDSPSSENFFYWLDHGAGKHLDLPQCPRERLEQDQVRYLSPEERLNYLVKVDDAGLFRWAKNNDLVDTNSRRFKDSLHGVVRIEDDLPQSGHPDVQSEQALASSSATSAASPTVMSDDDHEKTQISTQEDYELHKAMKKFSSIRPAVIYEHVASSLPKKNGMWIFVADTSFRIYIGIKSPGAFQHSSFLRGGRIAAAGMLKIRDGKLRSLAPLSGHYRPHVANFRAFHHSLQERGVDLSRVSFTKSYAMLAGIEGFTMTKRKIHHAHEKFDATKQKIHLA
ncbi:hypothetical protein N7492_004661 [Penicillium capsulatum]|uniref:IQ calmodulin-binding motif protein n=1 Tax=Penicillium capsulatum TaxID=69766 RepID=A0A9W9IAH0_9EURO|nr:hypothetical protein N7492_004661 [Penicillium capsulatum]KAJ6136227.1 hypothetical protein N7512_001387 [Penicillium capsulatum]